MLGQCMLLVITSDMVNRMSSYTWSDEVLRARFLQTCTVKYKTYHITKFITDCSLSRA